ncbi:hypothetical protein M6D81_03685 [Paenibacillus sp. J5C_2022]|nr:hypothetical protein [Paenibacillus sp. J5C2022]
MNEEWQKQNNAANMDEPQKHIFVAAGLRIQIPHGMRNTGAKHQNNSYCDDKHLTLKIKYKPHKTTRFIINKVVLL